LPEQINVKTRHDTTLRDHWPLLVSDYSPRELTLASDKLIALAGLASASSKSEINDKYLTGLWLSEGEVGRIDFLNQLCWNVTEPCRHGPVNYRAPLWSWVAIDGRVRFRFHPSGLREIGAALILEASTCLATSDPYGSIDAGFLILGGPLRCIRCKPNGLAMYHFELSFLD